MVTVENGELVLRVKRPALIVSSLAILTLFAVIDGWKRTHPPMPSEEQRQFVEVTAEQALISFGDRTIHVLLAAKIRPDAPFKKIKFVHISGYFLDQDGTRYSPGFAPVSNRILPAVGEISPRDTHELRTGEVYRYSLGPAEYQPALRSPEQTIRKITLYLPDEPARKLPLKTWSGFSDPNMWQ